MNISLVYVNSQTLETKEMQFKKSQLEIVLLKNNSTNRIHWKIATVEELIPGADGKVRAAIVKVGNSDK